MTVNKIDLLCSIKSAWDRLNCSISLSGVVELRKKACRFIVVCTEGLSADVTTCNISVPIAFT